MSDSFPAFATCLPGLEEVLEEELDEYGIGTERRVEAGGVGFVASKADIVHANRRLGVATLVRTEFCAMHVTKLPELERKARAIPFREWFASRPKVRVRCRKSRLYHTGAVAERIERALNEQFGESKDEAPELFVRIEKNRMSCSLNTSGEPLHRRGYRLHVAKAPLREDLARALLRVAWDRRSPLFDPMMGSGTLPIEGALLLGAGQTLRRFAYEDSPAFRDIVCRDNVVAEVFPKLIGSDRDLGALDAARSNAERAGVHEHLSLSHAPLSTSPGWVQGISVLTNPPYGKRIGRDVRPLLQTLGKRVQEFASSFACVLPNASPLARATGLPLRSVLMTDHGGMKVNFHRASLAPTTNA